MSENKKIQGVVIFFINLYPDLGQDVHVTMNLVKEMHQPLVDILNQEGKYPPIFIPTHKEATRVEKIDYDAPFPRYMAKSHDIMKIGLQDGIKKSKNNMFQQSSSKGVISIFVNFHPEMNLDIADTMNLVRTNNAESLSRIQEDGQYQLLLIPTTKEASRAEKVDWDMPFPRFVPKVQGKKNTIPKKVVTLVAADDDDDDEDEDNDELNKNNDEENNKAVESRDDR